MRLHYRIKIDKARGSANIVILSAALRQGQKRRELCQRRKMRFAGSHGGLSAGCIAQHKAAQLIHPCNEAGGESRSVAIDNGHGATCQARVRVELAGQRREPVARPRFVQRRKRGKNRFKHVVDRHLSEIGRIGGAILAAHLESLGRRADIHPNANAHPAPMPFQRDTAELRRRNRLRTVKRIVEPAARRSIRRIARHVCSIVR